MLTAKCDQCSKPLAEKNGFEVTKTIFILDRSDRDTDSQNLSQHACSPDCLQKLVPRGELTGRFSPKGKKSRTTAETTQ